MAVAGETEKKSHLLRKITETHYLRDLSGIS
jgi:hypothetical protein